MNTWRSALLAVVASVATLAIVTSAALAAPVPSDGPSIAAGQDATGTAFKVEGTGFTPDTLVNIELCGNEGLGGSSDCLVSSSQSVGVSSSGTFIGLLPIEVPPAPCPCIVRAISQDYRESAAAPVDVPGTVTSTPGTENLAPAVERQLSIESVSLTGNGPWTAWLGGSPERTLTITVLNTGEVTVKDALVNLWVGSGDNPTGFVPPIYLDPLESGASATYPVDIELGALTFGERTVRGEIRGVGTPTTFSTSTTTYPWLLIIVPAVLIAQWVLVRMRNRLRRRLYPEASDDGRPGGGPVETSSGDRTLPAPAGTATPAGGVEPAELSPDGTLEPLRGKPVAVGSHRVLPPPAIPPPAIPPPAIPPLLPPSPSHSIRPSMPTTIPHVGLPAPVCDMPRSAPSASSPRPGAGTAPAPPFSKPLAPPAGALSSASGP